MTPDGSAYVYSFVRNLADLYVVEGLEVSRIGVESRRFPMQMTLSTGAKARPLRDPRAASARAAWEKSTARGTSG